LSSRSIVILPEGAATRARVVQVIEGLRLMPATLPVPPEAELAIVDLTADKGHEALEALLKSPAGSKLKVLAITHPDGAERDLPGVADFVSTQALEAELGMRLQRARAQAHSDRESMQRQRETMVLLELTSRYATSTDVEEMLHEVTRRLADELEIDRAAMVVVDEARGEGVILAASDDPALKDLRIDLRRYPEIREALRTGKPVIVEDAPHHPLLESVKDDLAALGIRNIAALPLGVRGKVLGVLLLRRSSARGPFNNREVEFLATVAHATAVALRNAQKIDAIREQGEKEKDARIAAEERAARLKRYESYFEHLSDGVAILDDKACVLSLNPAGMRLLDLAPSEVSGRHINALTNPTDDGLMMDVLLSVSRGQVRTEVDIQARTLAGRRLTVSLSAAPLKGEGAVAILTMRDVTRQRALAEELQKTKEFQERLIDSSVDAIIASDMKGRIILFNKAAEVVCGWTSEDAKAHLNVKQLYSDSQAREVMQRLRSGEHGGVGRLTASRQEILTRMGDRIPVSMTASIVYEAGREVATLGIFTDLRDRLKLERKLSDVETRLEESEKNAVLVALAGTAAHELNQPLTSVMGYAELLRRKIKETEPIFRPIDIIYREAERMAEIVRKIGKITKYETKPYVGDAHILDLNRATSHEE